MATIAERENQDTLKNTHTKGKLVAPKLTKTESRKTLHTIQLSSRSDGKMIGKENLKDSLQSKCKEKIQLPKGSVTRPLQIYNDPSPQLKSTPKRVSLSDISTQTEVLEDQISPIDKEAFDLMVNDNIPEEYWEDLAEQRRMALSEALNENEELHTSICELKEENERLSKLASKTEYFAEVIKSFIGDDDDDDDEVEEVEGTEEACCKVIANNGNPKDTCALEVANTNESETETNAQDKDTEQNENSIQAKDVNEKNLSKNDAELKNIEENQ